MKPWLQEAAEQAPRSPALIFEAQSICYGELNAWAERLAAVFESRGVRAGDRVALDLPSSAAYVAALHALQRCRAVAVPLNTRLARGEKERLLGRLRSRLLIQGDGLLRDMPLAAEGERRSRGATDTAARARRERIEAGESWTLVFTSGTAGAAKGVLLSHANHEASARAANALLDFRAGDRWLCVVPLYHVAGLSILVRAALVCAAVALEERFDADGAIAAIAEKGVTHVSLVPTMLDRMLGRGWRARGTQLRCVLVGGGPISRGLIARALAADLPLYASYGLTETASQVVTATPEMLRAAVTGAAGGAARGGGCCASGLPLAGVEIRIDGPDENGAGEICVRGPQVARGYFEDAEATARVFRGGWLHTGDLGRIDESGALQVLARRGDLIVSGGENVVPGEVEEVLLGHASVAEAAVFAREDERWGQAVAAAVVLREGCRLDAEKLRAWCRERLAAYKVPRQIVSARELPRTTSGKLRRRDLPSLLEKT